MTLHQPRTRIRDLVAATCLILLVLAASAAAPSAAQNTAAQDIPSPESFFGFQMGADRHLANWDDLVRYYRALDEASPRLQIREMGPSTLGNSFLVLFISAPENLESLDRIRNLNARLSDPGNVSKIEIDEAISEGKAVVVQSFGLHSSEVAAAQTAAELTYDMLTRDDDEMMRILDNTVAIMIPSFNPDGTNMIADWYDQTVDTEYEGTGMPWLYHHYIGHDNNRDAFMRNTIESEYGARIIFREWIPQAYVDHHQMGSYSARMYVPPYAEPIRPDADPLVWREMAWYGAHIAYKEEEAGKAGIINAAIYSGWGHFGFHWITPFHNISGMLTESASARLATPLFIHPDQLEGSRRGMPAYEAQTSFPNPWEGGWWHVRDIVEQQEIAALAVLDIAARNRKTVLSNAYLKAKRQTERGAEGAIKAFIIPAVQHDPLTAVKMINVLLGQGVKVSRIDRGFTHEGRVYNAGSYVVSLAQPKRGVIRWLLGQTNYPDNTFTRDRDDNPIRPYDMSTDNIAEYMGVRVDPVRTPVSEPSVILRSEISREGRVELGSFGFVLDGRLSDSFRAVNMLWDKKMTVRRVDAFMTTGGRGLNPGDFLIPASVPASLVSEVARETGVDFRPLTVDASAVSRKVERLRIGLFQRYFGGNADEGWTRLLLENFDFPYTTVRDAEIKSSNLPDDFDVIILPDDRLRTMTGAPPEKKGYTGRGAEAYPPEYRSGFGDEGIASLEKFVQAGGTLVTFARAGDLALQKFNIPVEDVVEGLSSKEFWSPGSTLRMNFDTSNPLAYGMPKEGLGLFLGGNQAYKVLASDRNQDIQRVATFVDRDIKKSGWLLGEKHLSGMASVVDVRHGKGDILMIGFRAQHREQTHGTFKLVFNALVSRPDK